MDTVYFLPIKFPTVELRFNLLLNIVRVCIANWMRLAAAIFARLAAIFACILIAVACSLASPFPSKSCE